MANTYEVDVYNNSNLKGNACIYQNNQKDSLKLAWLIKETNPQEKSVFTWTPKFCFVWGDFTLNMENFKPSELIDALEGEESSITFTNKNNQFHFTDLTPKTTDGSVLIKRNLVSAPTMPSAVNVGIGMCGIATNVFRVNTNSNIKTNLKFTTNPEYLLAFGDFTEGQFVDYYHVSTQPVKINFPLGVYKLNAILNYNGTWTINPVH